MQNPSLEVSLEVQRTSSSEDSLRKQETESLRAIFLPEPKAIDLKSYPPVGNRCRFSSIITKMLLLSFILTLLVERLHAAGISSSADLTTTGILQTNSAPGYIESAMIYSQCTSPSNFNLIVSAVKSGLNVLSGITFWYADSANTLASATQILTLLGGNIYDVLDIDSQHYAVFADNGQQQILSLSVFLGSYSLTVVNSGTTPTNSRGSCRDATSSYSYYGPKSSTTKISKFDASNVNTYNLLLTFTVPAAADKSVTTLDFGPSSTLFYFGESSSAILVSTASMTATKTFTAKTFVAKHWVVDNTNSSRIFAVVETPATVFSIQSFDLTQASSTLTQLTTALSLAGSAGSGTRLLTFGPYKYIGYATTVSGNPTFRLARKTDLLVVSSTVYPGMTLTTDAVSPLTLTRSTNPSQGTYRINAMVDSGTYNMFVYTVNFLDNCALASATTAQCEEAINGYYIDTTTGSLTCIDLPSITAGKGLSNTIPQKVVFCTDANCLSCTYNASYCTQCAIGYYNQFGSCLLITSLPNGQGFDPVGFGQLPCQSVGCRVCQADYRVCMACYQPAYYLDTSVCYQTSTLPAGQGLVPATGGFGPCLAGPVCLDCRTDYSICINCDQVAGYFRLGNSCSAYASVPAGQGVDSINFAVKPCNSAGCINCRMDYLTCVQCDGTGAPKYYREGIICKDQTTTPIGFGYDAITGTIRVCAIIGCYSCASNYLQCELCDSQRAGQIGSTCVLWENFMPGHGYDSSSKSSTACASTGCLKCAKDYKICTRCDDATSNVLGMNQNYCLDSGACVVSSIGCLYTFKAALASCALDQVGKICLHLQNIQMLPDNLPIQEFLQFSSERLSPETTITNVFYPERFQLTKTTGATTGWLTLDLTFADRTLLREETYKIAVFTPTPREVTTNIPGSRVFRIELVNSTHSYFYKEPETEVFKAGQQIGSALRIGLGGPAIGTGVASIASWGAMALDPSGLLLKISQLLKLVGRLFYLNVAYGHRLNGFLSGLNNMLLLGREETPAEVIMNSGKWRGKLSKYHYSLDIVKVLLDKCLVYIFSAGFNLLLIILQRYQVSKSVLYLMYYWPKIHCLIYSVVIYDFFMLGFRTSLHSRVVTQSQWMLLYAAGIFMSVDTFETFRSVFELNRWKKKLLRDYISEERDPHTVMNSQASPTKTTNRQFRAQEDLFFRADSNKGIAFNRLAPKGNLFAHRDSLKAKLPLGLNPLVTISEIDKQTKLIDYKRTYEEININYHLMALQTSLLRPDAATYQPLVARALFLQAVFRTNMVSLIILAGQYMVTSLLAVMICIEILFIGALVFIGFKHQHMRSKVLYVADLIQRLSLSIFLTIAFLIHMKATSADENQAVGETAIVIIIIACVSEYLGVFIYFIMYLTNFLIKKYRASKSVSTIPGRLRILEASPELGPAESSTKHLAESERHNKPKEPKHPFLRFKDPEEVIKEPKPLVDLQKRDSLYASKHSRKASHDKMMIGTPKVNRLSVFSSAGQPSPQIVFNRVVKHPEKSSPGDYLSSDRDLVVGQNLASTSTPKNKPYLRKSGFGPTMESNISLREGVYPRSRFSSSHNMMGMVEASPHESYLHTHENVSQHQDTAAKEDAVTRLDTLRPEGSASVRLEGTPITRGVGLSSDKAPEQNNVLGITIRKLPVDKQKLSKEKDGRGSLLVKLKVSYNEAKQQ